MIGAAEIKHDASAYYEPKRELGVGVVTNRRQSCPRPAFMCGRRIAARSVADYWPLVSLILLSALAALAIVAGSGQTTMRGFMHAYGRVSHFLCPVENLRS